MTKETVMTVLAAKISQGVDDVIRLPDGSEVDVDFFASLFSSASDDPTYAELIDIDGGTRGYKPFFDACKAEGILS